MVNLDMGNGEILSFLEHIYLGWNKERIKSLGIPNDKP